MNKIFLYSLLVAEAIIQIQIAHSSQPPVSRIDDLPTNVKPIKYDLHIIVDLTNDEFPFMGNVCITIKCVANTKEIVLNVRDLKILESQVGLTETKSMRPKTIESQYYKPTKDQYIITLVEELITGETYNLYVPFKKKDSINFSDRGYIQYDYRKDPDQPKKTIALTKADINDARRFFPCMDHIGLKAIFKIRLTVPETMAAFTSIEYKDAIHHYNKDGTDVWRSTYEFENFIPMSTYSLAIVVASLSPTEHQVSSTRTTITVFSDASVSARMDFTRRVILQAFKFYLDYFKIDSTHVSPVGAHLDVLILPDFREMKTEKRAIIMLDETAVYPTNPSDYDNKTDIALRVCYEMSRQWIGVRATMSEWNEYWVQIALATFLRAPCLEKLLPGNQSDLLNWQLVESYTHVLNIDGESMSRPVHVPKDDFILTEAFTDSVLTEKAHLLIRMMSFFLGEDEFQEGVKKYYNDFQLKNSSLDEVWQVFDEVKSKNALWPKDVTFKTVMDSWTKKKGFPVVKVTRNYETKSVELTQERFLQLGEEDELIKTETTLKNNQWIIPLRYRTQTQLMQNVELQSPVNLWLTDAGTTISHPENELLFINLELNVLCRVQYEPEDWKLIRDILRDENIYYIIDEMSRVNLVSDMFAFAEVGKLPYEMLLDTMTYLHHEISDYPLMVALNEFNKIRSTLFGTEALKQFDKYMKLMLTPIFEKDRFVNIHELSEFDRQGNKLKKLIIEISCNVGVKKCIEQCKHLFQKWIENDLIGQENPIPEDIRTIVSCQAIKHGGQIEWSFLHLQYDQDLDQTFRETILTALGCTKISETLQTYLNWITDSRYKYPTKDWLIAFSGLASNEEGYQKMKNFIELRLYDLIKRFDGYKGIIGSFLAKLFEVTNTRKDFTEIRKLTKSVLDHVRDSENILIQSMKMAERNFLWRRMHEETIEKVTYNLGATSRVKDETQK